MKITLFTVIAVIGTQTYLILDRLNDIVKLLQQALRNVNIVRLLQ